MFGKKPLDFARRSTVALLFAGGLSACVPSTGTTTSSNGDGPRVNPKATVKVALLVPSGSGNANHDSLADNLTKAAEMALKDHPEAKIRLKVYSTGGNAQQAASAARAALSDGSKVIIGPLFAEAANAVGQVAATKGINVLSFSNNTDVAGGNVFVMGNTFQNTANRIVSHASAQGFKSIAVIAPQNAAGQLASSAVRSAVSRSGARFAGAHSYPFSPEGISSSMPGIMSKISGSGATAVVLTADSASGLPIISSMMPTSTDDLEQSVKVLGLARWDIPSTTLSAPGLRGGWFTIPDRAAITAFNSRFSQTYGTTAHPLAGIAYDGVSAVAELLTEKNPGAVQRSQLTRTKGFFGASGAFRLIKDGSTQRALSVAEAGIGSFKVISNAPTSFGGSGL
ncbi:penicillin-binding protein activator [Amylibacter marinus]|uniref:Penicillin-binding protein activator n=1 Tax=Amylibacter marinus TaxID=1475483 RepID=A0ABQ5VUK1_9RHOB|nr:penicillin-binding protein activator [Amylibacter marinus]GLQ35004.1 penicillin-binding protein activator [Amylibacter marinus]